MATDILSQLSREGLVKQTPSGWGLTELGGATAYNLCELAIQDLSGFWKLVLSNLPSWRGARRMLDVGCSGGISAIPASGAGMLSLDGIYLGLDVDHKGLRAGINLMARFRGARPDVAFIEGDANKLPIESGVVDAVVSRATLFYIPKRKVLGEITRILASGGSLVVTVPTLRYGCMRTWEGVLKFRVPPSRQIRHRP